MTTPPAPPLAMRDVGKRFGDTWVLRGLDLEIGPGTIVGLIGPSGSGKTTTVRLALGALSPDEGTVELLGHPAGELSSEARLRVGYLPQEPVLFDELSAWENLAFHASLNGVRFRSRRHRRQVLELVELDEHRRKAVHQMSGGMKRRLALAAALVHQPDFVVLDEPTAGIDPVLRRTFWDHFRSLREEGCSFVVTTQYVGEAVDCDLVVLLAEGGIVASGSPDELRRRAVGGDVVEVETDRHPEWQTVEELRSADGVHRVSLIGPTRVRLLVDDGGLALPMAVGRLEAAGLTIVDSEEPTISYDEVFVRLIEQRRPTERESVTA